MARRAGATTNEANERVKKIMDEMSDPNVCGQIRRDGNLCQRHAGWGTDHVGKGPCRYHEYQRGDLARIPGGGDTRSSRYGEITPALDFYMELVNDPEIKRLDDEIALLRMAMIDVQDSIDEVRSRFQDKKMPLNKEVSGIILKLNDQRVKLAETIGKLVDRKHKIEEGKLVTYRQVQETLAQVVYIIKKHVSEETVLERIAEDFRRIDMSKFE